MSDDDGRDLEHLDGILDGAIGDDEAGMDPAAAEAWELTVADMEATADQYREDGWAVLAVHPGDVTVRTDERVGLDVLVPNDEFDRLQDLLSAGVAFDDSKVYRATHEGVVAVVVVVEDDEAETAVVYPAYYEAGDSDAHEMLSQARAEGELRSYLRVLTGEYVAFTHEEPSLFVPDGEE